MSNLKANLYIDTVSDLSVRFIDKSSGSIGSWLWKFGFIDLITTQEKQSTDQNPQIIFPAIGKYIITLLITGNNDDLGLTSLSNQEMILYASNELGLSIMQIIQNDLVVSYNIAFVIQDIKNWQNLLAKFANLSGSDIYDESKWPFLHNSLIAKLVEYDLIIDASKQLFLNAGAVTESGTLGGVLKAYEAGPTRMEWQDMSSFWKNLSTVSNGATMLDFIRQEICQIAGVLNIKLAICGAIKRFTPFIITHPNGTFDCSSVGFN